MDLLLYDKLPITIGTMGSPNTRHRLRELSHLSCLTFSRNRHRHTGTWKTSLADPLLLGTYYAVAGALILALDEFSGSAEDRQRILAHSSPAWVALSFG